MPHAERQRLLANKPLYLLRARRRSQRPGVVVNGASFNLSAKSREIKRSCVCFVAWLGDLIAVAEYRVEGSEGGLIID